MGERISPHVIGAGRSDRAVQSRYRLLFTRNQPRRDGAEMARLAKEIGRSFEARAFQTLALKQPKLGVISPARSSDHPAEPIQDGPG